MTTEAISVTGRIKMDASGVDKGTKEAEKSLVKFGKVSNVNLASLGIALGAVALSLGTVQRAAEMAYSGLKEGAALELAQSRFENLSASIDTTADSLLGRLREATGGMISDAELITSATDMMNLGFAKTEDQAVRLTSVAGQLGWNMQQLTLTLANQSTMRLDALGLSVEEVTGRFRELKEQGIAVQDAFQMAVIEAGEKKLKLLGSAAETSAGKLMRFEASVDNITNALKLSAVQLAENIGLIDKLVEVSSGLARAAGFQEELNRAIANGLITREQYAALEAAPRGNNINRETGLMTDVGAFAQLDMLMKLKQAWDDATISREQYFTLADNVGTAEGYYEAERQVELAVDLKAALDKQIISETTYQRLMRDAARNYQAVRNEIDRYNAQLKYSQEYTGLVEKATREAQGAMWDWKEYVGFGAAEQEKYALALDRGTMALSAQETRLATAAAALEAWKQAFNSVSADYMTPLEGAGEPLITPELSVSVTTGGPTQEQAELLAEYSDLAEKAAEEIYNLTNGIGTFGMAQEDVNEKIAAAQEELTYYQEKMAPLSGIVGEVSTSQQGLAVNTAAVYDALYKQAEAAGAAPEQLVALGVATGIMSEAQAIAALKAAALWTEIDKLGKLIAAGYPMDKALQDLQNAITVLEGGFIPATQEAQDNALAIRDKMIEAAEGALEPAEELGTNVAEGVTGGIEDATGEAETAAEELGQDIIDAAKQKLGIQSPSTVFAGIGADIIAGLVAGIRANAAGVEAALRGIIEAAIARIKALLGIASPSRVFSEIGENIALGLIEGIDRNAEDVVAAVQKVMSSILGVGGRFAKDYESQVLDPIQEAIEALDDSIDSLDDTVNHLGGAMRGALANLQGIIPEGSLQEIANASLYSQRKMLWEAYNAAAGNDERKRIREAIALVEQQIALEEQRRQIEEERSAAAAEYAAQQERILAFQEKQAQLDFLKTQLDLLKLIDENGLDRSILEGLTFGLGANTGDVLDAMIAAMGQLVTAAEDELDIHSPSKVFAGIGRNIMAGLVEGIKGGRFSETLRAMLDSAIDPNLLGSLRLDTLATPMSDGLSAVGMGANTNTNYQNLYVYGGVQMTRTHGQPNSFIEDIYGASR